MVSTRLITADDLFRLGPDAPYELIEGELVEVNPPGGIHGAVLSVLNFEIQAFVRPRGLGTVFVGGTGFVLHQQPDTVLGPDLAFVRRGRLPENPIAYIHLVPDLVVEVVSPSNTRASIDRKIAIYLEAGVEQVWILDPVRIELLIHRTDEPVATYGYDDNVPGGDTLPGFEMRLGVLFE